MLPTRKSQLQAVRTVLPIDLTQQEPERPRLLDFIAKRDWSGAFGVASFEKSAAIGASKFNSAMTSTLWMVYCSYHSGDFTKALKLLSEVIAAMGAQSEPEWYTYQAMCLFRLGRLREAEQSLKMGAPGPLANRLAFHISQKGGSEEDLLKHHQQLTLAIEDQLSLASMHYLRGHYQEATDIYRKLLVTNKEYDALNVYVAMCYYKLDYFDVSNEIVQLYLTKFPDSLVAINLKACAAYKLYNGAAAVAEIKTLADLQGVAVDKLDNELVKHNLVVFRGGENAMQVLPPLLEIISEARSNLVIHHLHEGNVDEAYSLLQKNEPSTPEEYILKGVASAFWGQLKDDKAVLKQAQQYLQLVGSSASHCDTIPGRQAMAMCFFLMEQFDDALIYLKSIKAYCGSDDSFKWNYGVALASVGKYSEASLQLASIQNPAYLMDFHCISWTCKCLIFIGKPQEAWEMYLRMDNASDSFLLLQVLANDCYKTGAFYFSLKAFDVLERLDPTPQYWDGKKGAAIGVFQLVIAEKEEFGRLQEAFHMLRSSDNPQAQMFMRVMSKWAKGVGRSIV